MAKEGLRGQPVLVRLDHETRQALRRQAKKHKQYVSEVMRHGIRYWLWLNGEMEHSPFPQAPQAES